MGETNNPEVPSGRSCMAQIGGDERWEVLRGRGHRDHSIGRVALRPGGRQATPGQHGVAWHSGPRQARQSTTAAFIKCWRQRVAASPSGGPPNRGYEATESPRSYRVDGQGEMPEARDRERGCARPRPLTQRTIRCIGRGFLASVTDRGLGGLPGNLGRVGCRQTLPSLSVPSVAGASLRGPKISGISPSPAAPGMSTMPGHPLSRFLPSTDFRSP